MEILWHVYFLFAENTQLKPKMNGYLVAIYSDYCGNMKL